MVGLVTMDWSDGASPALGEELWKQQGGRMAVFDEDESCPWSALFV